MDDINRLVKQFMQDGMNYTDIMNADLNHLLEVLSTKDKKKEDQVVDLADFVKALP
ncbi:hypothetical protein [Rummeliibacillus sp. TYF-LIM-RU47]|uniref:hypothetical protein n=1 Tax=Rummeliibacillus sp. TYF-LIM-RU47 TaxID=2608406 RepID=UPI0016809364|nr:hypothetical protein [Rummeliibacillus sp. TYF-LIM-RU47]